MKSLNNLYILLGTAGIMGVLVMDEEVLVLGCWVVFVCLAYTYGSSTVNEIFEERRAKFAEDILSSYTFQEMATKALINYHNIQVSVLSEIKELFDFSKSEISRILGQRRDSFKSIIGSQIEQKLSILADKEAAVASQVQESIHSTVSQNVFTLFKSKEKNVKVLKEKILNESMSKFESISKA
jgi:hypothetical protein